MGLLDLPSPLFSWLDEQLTGLLPPTAKLLLWAMLGALVSMDLYRLLSPQQRITALKIELQEAQQRVADYDGSLERAWPLIGRMLSLALRRVFLVLPATIAASLPLLALIIWLDSAYSWAFPPSGEQVRVQVAGQYQGRWVSARDAEPPRALVLNDNGGIVSDVPLAAPIPIVHKRHWWNVLIGNPAGYLPDDAPVERIQLGLPRQELISFGPDWLRGWEIVFFPALILFALAFKVARRIE